MQRAAPAGYESDCFRWAEEQAAALREGRHAGLDMAHLLEEIDDPARSERREFLSRLTTLTVHLLKFRYQPEPATGSWRGTSIEQATRIRRVLKSSPSLQPELPGFSVEAYADARPQAAAKTERPLITFPESPSPDFARAAISLSRRRLRSLTSPKRAENHTARTCRKNAR